MLKISQAVVFLSTKAHKLNSNEENDSYEMMIADGKTIEKNFLLQIAGK